MRTACHLFYIIKHNGTNGKKEQINKNEAKKNYPKKNTSYWQAVVRHTSAVHAAAAAVGSVHRREEKKKKK